MIRCLALAFVLHALAASAASAQEGTHPFTVHDMLAMDRLSDPRPSPDGRTIVFVSSVTDLGANRRRTDLFTVPAQGGTLRRLTSHEAGDTHPRWAPDGRSIFFLSTRSGSSQVWRIAADGGEAQPVTSEPLDVGSFALSPDGRLLAYSMEVFPDCDSVACTRQRLDEVAARKATGRLYESLFIRHWDTWSTGTRSHLFVRPVAGGEPVDVTRGMQADVPSKPFGGAEEYTFTADGRAVVFTARDAGREEAWSTDFDLFVAPADGSAARRNLTEANPAWDTLPVFSPDGRTLAWLAMERPGYESDRYRIVLRSWPDGAPRVLTQAWDRSPQDLAWTSDGRSLLATAHNLGHTSLFAIDAGSGRVRTLVEQGTAKAPAPSGDRVVLTLESHRAPAEIHSVRTDGSDLRTLTRVNAAKVAAARMGEPEQFRFQGAHGDTVHGWVVKPVDFDRGKRYPIAFLIHGGPQGSWTSEFHYRWNPQVYAGAGYGAVLIDFHGSTGYGQAFTDAIRGDWGGAPLEDLQKGLAAAIERYPWLDGQRACALGASYGGYMINWIAGQWPDRFRCLVSHDGNLDERMAYFDTEELWFPEWEHGGTPWESPEGYARHNPIEHVGRWKTPMLVIHGGQDFRVVDTQGMSTFTALQRRGIPSQFLHFPDENHWVLKPHNSILWHETVLGWLERWLRPRS